MQRQEALSAALQGVSATKSDDPGSQRATGQYSSDTSAQAVVAADQQSAPAAAGRKHNKDVVQYSRRLVPTAKQKAQEMQSQYLLDMKEYFAEVPVRQHLASILGTD